LVEGVALIPRYSRPEMSALWSDANRLRLWTEIEILACEARAARGALPAAEAAGIRARAEHAGIVRPHALAACRMGDVVVAIDRRRAHGLRVHASIA